MELMINNFETEAIVITAPTGVAAINICENTLQSRLSVPVKSANFTELKNDSLRKFQKKIKNLKFIVMDEMSMIGVRMLHHIESQCSSIFPNNKE